MKYKLKVYSIWEYGQRKDAEGNPHQEDCTYPLPKDLKDSDRTFILCDGMGGHDAGEVASATVCETMGSYILSDGHDSDGIFTDDDLKNAIAAAFSTLDKKDSGAEKKMGTTMTFLKLHNNGATITHMGDSRVYHIRPGEKGEDTQILFETEDHSLVNDLIKIGELTKEEARTSKQKNVITRAMQPNMERKPKADIKHITDIKSGDFFYMCSDGMLEQEEMANGESIKNIFSNTIKSVDDKVTILTKVTENNKDNHTALIIHILDVEGTVKQQQGKTESTSIPSIGIGLVEDEESTEEIASSKDYASLEKSKEELENTSEADNFDKSEETDKTANVIEDKSRQVLSGNDGSLKSYNVAPRGKKPVIKMFNMPKSKPILSKLILRGIIVAIVVAACIVGINYFPSCSEQKNPEKIEHQQRKQGKDKRNNSGKRDSQNQVNSQTGSQHQESAQEVALDAANSDAAQAATEDNSQQSTTSIGNAAAIQLPAQTGVVSSDQQALQETLNK